MKQHVDSKQHPSEPRRDPVDIHSVPPHDLLRLLATLLTQIASANDSLSSRSDPSPSAPHFDQSSSPVWKSLTTASKSSLGNTSSSLSFHARNIPTITLEAYLLRIHKYCPTTNEVFLSLLVYFDRISKLAAQVTGKPFVIDSYNIHRLVIAGVTVASKFFSDVFYTNSRYAKVGGLPQTELNQLELQFLLLNDFRLMISPQEMQRYAEQLVLFSQLRSEGDLSSMPPRSPSSLSAPMQTMGAIDAYGGSFVGSTHRADHISHSSTSASATSNHKNGARTPQVRPREPTINNGAVSETDTSDADTTSEAGTETDAETDDEPTIRPNQSSGSSDTMSMHSYTSEDTDADAAGDGRDHRMGSP
ncbi:cyclin-domain-containing protein [Thelephora terrestris]|uniref:Cyclin-domain-containing protein n=1 Tax=Thelephora terrestris TaxID=56493 RepID=A0A9P6H5V6_9AGAM|nr:cyclin-domain-containing protein [Thelephora terrestris]